jgi:glycerophosphoryl diester phosphodiesterase
LIVGDPVHRLSRIGHRGAAGHAPESTLAAIEQGIALCVDGVISNFPDRIKKQ